MEVNREIGIYTQKHPGPLLVVTAGIHGNEPAGIIALQNVFKKLSEKELPIRGTFVGLAGNTAALKKNVRFIDEDMNRLWEKEVLFAENGDEQYNSEITEARELLTRIQQELGNPKQARFQVDIHTTSSESIPYISVSRNKGCQVFANSFPLHDVVGFGSFVRGAIDKYFCKNSFNGFTVEAGQHNSKSSIEDSEAFIWMALAITGCMDTEHIEDYKHSREILAKYIIDEKKNFQIIYRFPIDEIDEFEMEKGFINFQKIYKGELLAHLNGKPVISKWNARILMPLYQSQGDDGFFVIEEIDEKEEEEILDLHKSGRR